MDKKFLKISKKCVTLLEKVPFYIVGGGEPDGLCTNALAQC